MISLGRDLLYGLRLCRARPGFTLAAVLSLGIGIGANATIFSLVAASLLRAFPYPDSDQVTILWTSQADRPDQRFNSTPRNYLEWKRRLTSFSALGATSTTEATIATERDGRAAEQVTVQHFTDSMWEVLGTRPVRGRLFTETEERTAAPVAVISHRLWLNRYSQDPGIVGRRISLDGAEQTIIGVMPYGFDFLSTRTDVFVPAGFSIDKANSTANTLLVAGRRKPSITLAQARAEAGSVSKALQIAFPGQNRNIIIRLETLREALFADAERPLLVLQISVAFVLLIACSNVAGLLLARSASRQGEIAVRFAMGSDRKRIIQQLLTESSLLSLAGGLLGCGLAWMGLRVLVAWMPPEAEFFRDASIDPHVFALTMLTSLVTAIVFGIVPAFHTSRQPLFTSANAAGSGSSHSRSWGYFRSALVTVQIALSLVLLIGASLMMTSFLKLQNRSLGADPSNLLTFEVRFGRTQATRPVDTASGRLWRLAPKTKLTYDAVYARVRTLPKLLSAAGVSRAPMSGEGIFVPFRIIGHPLPVIGEEAMNAQYSAITPDYFRTLRVPLLRGRDFSATDNESATHVAVINRALADRWWPDEDPLGKLITLSLSPDEPARQVVGVVGNMVVSRFERHPVPAIFVPYTQQPEYWPGYLRDVPGMLVFVLRTPDRPEGLIPSIRAATSEVDPNRAAGNFRTVEQYLKDQIQGLHIYSLLLGVFGICATLLALIGIYGLTAYMVSSRTREIGIRMALGSLPSQVVRLVMRQAAFFVGIGLLVGAAGALALTRFLQADLVEVQHNDPTILAAVVVIFAAITLFAALIPSIRAALIPPSSSLRYE